MSTAARPLRPTPLPEGLMLSAPLRHVRFQLYMKLQRAAIQAYAVGGGTPDQFCHRYAEGFRRHFGWITD